eukprot:scaffold254052_cov27-Tisochrysis_lutea.AAC.3
MAPDDAKRGCDGDCRCDGGSAGAGAGGGGGRGLLVKSSSNVEEKAALAAILPEEEAPKPPAVGAGAGLGTLKPKPESNVDCGSAPKLAPNTCGADGAGAAAKLMPKSAVAPGAYWRPPAIGAGVGEAVAPRAPPPNCCVLSLYSLWNAWCPAGEFSHPELQPGLW